MEALSGQVESVRIVRDGWGYLTILYGSDRERATVVGHPLGIATGDTVECDGLWTTHPRYGRQFKARSIRTVAPFDASGAIEWMLARLPGIGRRRATEIVTRWPIPELWTVLGERPQELATIDGITPERAAKIGAAYQTHLADRDRVVALRSWGLSESQASRVVAKWGDAALEHLRADPYLLAQEIDGFGFKRSDEVARKMGLPADHPSRIRAGLEHLLSEARQAGHTYVPAAKLIAMGARLLGVPEDAVVREGRAAMEAGRMVRREAPGRDGEPVQRVYSPGLDEAEQAVAEAVRRLLRGERIATKRENERGGRLEDDGFDALGADVDRQVRERGGEAA